MSYSVRVSSVLTALRKAQDRSVYAVAKGTTVPRSVIDRLERDAKDAKLWQLEALAEFYGLPTVSDLLLLAAVERNQSNAA
jgi:predicted transcriptional regulator